MKKNRSIRVKFAILTSIFTIIPTLSVIAYTTITLQNTLRKEIVDSNQYQMQWANQLINDIYLRADSLFIDDLSITAISSVLIMSMLPAVVFYMILQKSILKGISEGALKQ